MFVCHLPLSLFLQRLLLAGTMNSDVRTGQCKRRSFILQKELFAHSWGGELAVVTGCSASCSLLPLHWLGLPSLARVTHWRAARRPTAGLWNSACIAGRHFSAFQRETSDQEESHRGQCSTCPIYTHTYLYIYMYMYICN